jgi:hypothetical protein
MTAGGMPGIEQQAKLSEAASFATSYSLCQRTGINNGLTLSWPQRRLSMDDGTTSATQSPKERAA